ncbi:GUN4 domain-containing protein [Cylindrospermopsis raciborskii G7]|uniref:GUN4 domain-containing protein n=1 Tax=Cylindrospermopsis raciborskii TaxID=77022 RepID=UPI003EBCFAC8
MQRDLQQRIESISNYNTRLRQYITELEICVEQIKQEKEDQQKQIAELLKEQTKLNEMVARLQTVQDVRQMQQELENKEAQIRNLQEKNEAIQAENLKLQGEITTLQAARNSEDEQQTTPSIPTPSRYTNLETLLKAENFKLADQETSSVMLALAKRQKEGYLRVEDAENFPYEELRTIDNLWLKYSQGKFGISVQQEIYKNLGGTKQFNLNVWRSFGDRVGWRKQGSWLNYSDLNFSTLAPVGHLPTVRLAPGSSHSGWKNGVGVWVSRSVLPSCQDM